MKKLLLLLSLFLSSSVLFSQNQPYQFNNVCDDNNDGFATFYMQEIAFEISGNNPNAIVTNHLTQTDALIGANPLPSLYTNTMNPQVIYARIYDTVTATATVIAYSLTVNPTPQAPTQTLTVCTNTGGTLNCWDLTQTIPSILNGSSNIVSFFQTQTDAQINANVIVDPFCYISVVATPTPAPLYYRIDDTFTGCSSVGTILLIPITCANNCEAPVALTTTQVSSNSAVVTWTNTTTSGYHYII
jgi:hypothetical protein